MNPPGPTTVSATRTKLATHADMASRMYARLERISRATYFRQEAYKYLRLEQGRYKKDNDQRVRLAPIFQVRYYIFLDRLSLFRSAAERPASEWYNKLILREQGPYSVTSVNETSLPVVQDELENIVSFYPATVIPASRRN